MARQSATARVTSKGQVTVPVEIRRALGIETGDDLHFDLEPGGARAPGREAEAPVWAFRRPAHRASVSRQG